MGNQQCFDSGCPRRSISFHRARVQNVLEVAREICDLPHTLDTIAPTGVVRLRSSRFLKITSPFLLLSDLVEVMSASRVCFLPADDSLCAAAPASFMPPDGPLCAAAPAPLLAS